MLNVLNGKGNGKEKDAAWSWKSNPNWERPVGGRIPTRELRDFGKSEGLKGQARL